MRIRSLSREENTISVRISRSITSVHYGLKQSDIETSNYTLSYELGSERMSAAECASIASRAEQVNE